MIPLTSFGQPYGGICQVAYVVEDLHQGMRDFSEKFNIGPWFYTDQYTLYNAKYRGQPTDTSMALALSFSGNMCFELITPDERPSVYRDIIKTKGYGYHHLGWATVEFEQDLARFKSMGYEVAFEGQTPRGIRLAYMDTSGDMPGMMELIEFNDMQNQLFKRVQDACVGWDGRDPIRKIDTILKTLTSPKTTD